MKCFSFTGSNYASIAELSSNLIGGGGSFTVSFLAKPIDPGGSGRISFSIGASTNIVLLAIPQTSVTYPVGIATVNGTTKYINGIAGSVVSDTWDQWHVVWDQVALRGKLYKNGIYQAQTTAFAGGFASIAATAFQLGSTSFGGQQLADIRLYSADTMPNHSIPATQESNLVAWYLRPDADGNARDYSGNGNHMITNGGSLYSASGGPGLPWYPDTTGGFGPELFNIDNVVVSANWTKNATQLIYDGLQNRFTATLPATFSAGEYSVRFTVVDGGGSSAFGILNNETTEYIYPQSIHANSEYSVTATATVSTSAIKLYGLAVGGAFKLQDISIRKIL